jgi:hypothetical protein
MLCGLHLEKIGNTSLSRLALELEQPSLAATSNLRKMRKKAKKLNQQLDQPEGRASAVQPFLQVQS